MHTLRNRILFFGTTLAAGLASLMLHRHMMSTCIDDRGLLIAGNLPGLLLWAVGIAFVLFLRFSLRTIGGDGSYADNFPPCMLSGGLMIAAGALLSCMLPQLELVGSTALPAVSGMSALVQQITAAAMGILPRAASVSMSILGLLRMYGKRPWPVFSGIICLFYMLMLVSNYRLWSANPNLHHYAYQLLAHVLLMLSAFHRLSCDAGVIQRRKLLATGLSAAVCACAAMSMDFLPGFFLASGLWAAGSMCNVAVLPPDPEEEEPEQTEEAEAAKETEETE